MKKIVLIDNNKLTYGLYEEKILRAEQSRAEQSRAEQSRAERLPWIDVLKGTGIILVVLGHIFTNKTIYNWLYSFHMPLFFFAAGLVYKKKPVMEDIKRRIQTIVIPYFSFGFLVLIYWQIVERRFRTSDISFVDSLLGLISGQYEYLAFNVHLWFLPCFFMTVVMFNVMVNIGNNRTGYVISVVLSIFYAIIPLPGMLWGINWIAKYIGFYALGVGLSEIIKKEITYKKLLWIGTATILMGLNFFLAYNRLITGIMWFVTATVGVIGVALISLSINENKILQYLGRNSLVTLCVHGPIYRVILKIISIPFHVSTDTLRENFLLSGVTVVITLIICSVIYEIIDRITPWMIGKKKYRNR